MLKHRPLALVTGASSGIGFHLAKCCANHGFNLLVVANEPFIEEAAKSLRDMDVDVVAVQADLSTSDGVARAYGAARGRPIAALLANAGRGLGKGFLDQDFCAARHVIDTNVTGTLELIHRVGREMRALNGGRILITGSVAGYMPGTFQAVYNGTKAFIDSFAVALRHELSNSGVTVTCLLPGLTDTLFFERADMMDTQLGQSEHKADPADVAKAGFDAMMRGESHVITGAANKLQAVLASVTPADVLAERHRNQASPGSGIP
jgi:short-subunit dehydrogenase